MGYIGQAIIGVRVPNSTHVVSIKQRRILAAFSGILKESGKIEISIFLDRSIKRVTKTKKSVDTMQGKTLSLTFLSKQRMKKSGGVSVSFCMVSIGIIFGYFTLRSFKILKKIKLAKLVTLNTVLHGDRKAAVKPQFYLLFLNYFRKMPVGQM